MSDWAQTGFDAQDDADAYDSGSSGGQQTWTAWTPVGETKVYLFLDDDPFCFWQHSMYFFTKERGTEICLDRNKIGDCKCSMCEHNQDKSTPKDNKVWPQFAGYLTVIDCGTAQYDDNGAISLMPYINDEKKRFQFQKRLFCMKKGSKDKPGLLSKFRREKQKKGGSLTGTVWTAHRAGKIEETVGTEWEFIGRVDVSSDEALKKSLVSLDSLKRDGTQLIKDVPLTGVEDELIEKLTAAPVNYSSAFTPKTYAQLQVITKRNHSGGSGGGGYQPTPPDDSGNMGGGQAEDDIPFAECCNSEPEWVRRLMMC